MRTFKVFCLFDEYEQRSREIRGFPIYLCRYGVGSRNILTQLFLPGECSSSSPILLTKTTCYYSLLRNSSSSLSRFLPTYFVYKVFYHINTTRLDFLLPGPCQFIRSALPPELSSLITCNHHCPTRVLVTSKSFPHFFQKRNSVGGLGTSVNIYHPSIPWYQRLKRQP